MKKRPVVVDTNVALLANRRGSAGPDCVRACADALYKVMRGGPAVIDTGWLIIGEYKNKLSSTGQPGPGDAFLKWLLSNLANPGRCRQIEITPRNYLDFEEFPATPALRRFDPSDRKFVAVAAADPDRPPILQGLDSKWWGFRRALEAVGIEVDFLCEEEIAEKHEAKTLKKGSAR